MSRYSELTLLSAMLKIIKFYAITHFAIVGLAAQKIENINSSLAIDAAGNTRYNVYYDLIAPFDNIPFEIKVKVTLKVPGGEKSFYSTNLTGSAGHLVLPGKRKHLIWDHVEELVHYNGEIILTLEAIPDLKVPYKIKKGKGLSIQLSEAFTTDKTYTIKLYRKGIFIAKLNELKVKENLIPVAFPPKSKVGNNYQFVISDGENEFFSNALKLKPKVGYGIIALPVLIVPSYLIATNSFEL